MHYSSLDWCFFSEMMRSLSGQCHATVRLQLQNQIETRKVWSGHEVAMKCPFNFHSNLTIYAVQVWSFVLRRLPVILLRLYSQLRLSCAQQITHYHNSEIWFQYWVCEIKLCYQWVRVVSCLGTLVFSGNCKRIFFLSHYPSSLSLHENNMAAKVYGAFAC